MAKKAKSKTLSPIQIGVKTLSPSKLRANPHSPRVLFDKAPLQTLKESIQKVGILVPLTVYFDIKKKHYVILDGQRRWICAKELGLPTIPVNQVAQPTLVQNIVTMFQIHKLREDWDLMPSALKLELLMDELAEKNNEKLAALTGLDQAVVQRCKKLLSYSKKYQDMMLDFEPTKRIKADFFIELYVVRTDRLVNTFDWFTKDKFTKAMLKRYKEGDLRSVTDFRKIKQAINQARVAGKERVISKRLKSFTENQDLGIEHLEISSAAVTAEAKAMTKQAVKLLTEISKIEIDSYVGEADFWESLEQLSEGIRKKLLAAGRRVK